jgi:H+/gluconate symporter-like permease
MHVQQHQHHHACYWLSLAIDDGVCALYSFVAILQARTTLCYWRLVCCVLLASFFHALTLPLPPMIMMVRPISVSNCSKINIYPGSPMHI